MCPSEAIAVARAFYARHGFTSADERSHVYARSRCEPVGERTGTPLAPGQLASFAELFARLFPQLPHVAAHVTDATIRERPRRDELVRVVACANGDVDGFAIARRRPYRGVELVALGVREQARGRGIAAALVRSVLAWARTRVELTVLASAVPAVRLYERLGFSRIGSGIDWHARAE
jgi:ribosomal protein S18 acetylase RimI-like enzyme